MVICCVEKEFCSDMQFFVYEDEKFRDAYGIPSDHQTFSIPAFRFDLVVQTVNNILFDFFEENSSQVI